MSFLLDTNVVSEIRRGRDPYVRAWANGVEDIDLHVSVMTLGEIRKGIELLRSRDPIQAEVFANWLGELRTRFAERIVPIDVSSGPNSRLKAICCAGSGSFNCDSHRRCAPQARR